MTASVQDLPYPESVQTYQRQAEHSASEVEKNTYTLKSIGRLIHDGQPKTATQKLTTLHRLTNEQQAEKLLLEAKLALLDRQSKTALKLLANVKNSDNLPPTLKQLYHQLLADTYHLNGAIISEVGQLMQLDQLQVNTANQLTIRRNIWQALSNVPLARLQTNAIDAQEPLEGWLSLALIAKKYRDDESTFLSQIKLWQQTHPTHPANVIAQSNEQFFIKTPTKLAFLLPLSGQLSGPGQAIRDGVMASYFEAKSKGASIKFYDTASSNVLDLYQQALNEGAEFVIGPLAKKEVEAIAKVKHPVPTLALNDVEIAPSNNFYRFSVDPQNEAQQLAYYVHDKGLRHALVIAPMGVWGESIANAFNQSWQKLNDQPSAQLYVDNKSDINNAIRNILGISNSDERYNNLVKTIWQRPKFYARRRQDLDVVVLLAYPSMARQVRPMLNYYYAGDLPIYGTSLLYSGSPMPRQDSDLNGIIFAEMPYLLDNNNPQVTKNWPEQFNSYNRLFAMGKDAYLLSQQLNLLQTFPMMGLADNTGTLFIDGEQQIIRQPSWAEFKQGQVQPLIS